MAGALILTPRSAPSSEQVQTVSQEIVALHQAINSGNEVEAGRLIDAGADVNGRDQNGRTPFEAAISRQDLDMLRLLIDRGANVSAITSTRTTLLVHAVHSGTVEAVGLLIASGADPSRK